MSEKVYGIDLGTTYSAVALVNETGMAEIVKNFIGEDATPSVLYFEDDGSVVVGSQAKQTQVSDPENSCSLIKRHMGEEYPLEFRGATYTPESISAIILKELVNSANSQNGLNINKAIITVPAYFGIQERAATRQAGEMAGLDVVGIIPEPVAAAISLGTRQEQLQTLLVFDLGGGTFDTTVIKARSGEVDVVAIDGNRMLGGADWDRRLEDLFLQKFVTQCGLEDDDPSMDDDFMIELKVKVEDQKKMLTVRPATKLRLSYQGKTGTIEVTRAEFEAATADLVAQTVEITNRAIATAKDKDPGLEIDRLLLVGGSSRMPMIEESLRGAGFEPERTDFDLSVAKGASVFGLGELPEYQFGGNASEASDTETTGGGPDNRPRVAPGAGPAPTKTIVTNVLSRGLGVEFVRQGPTGEWDQPYVAFLAHANDRLPLTITTEAATVMENQETVSADLYEQGGEIESEDPADNKTMAGGDSTTIHGLPKLPAGSPLQISLEVSEEGIATLVVTEPTSSRSFRAEGSVAVLSKDEVAKAKVRIALLPTSS
ncbi:molecular chaperone DnaK [Enemella evansiae]|uniref:Hsp70 family protein n=1 Tax=Enemella evansiae TaxID=2016499 RepID=UPI000B96C3E5|nr:Hsp70 family protein [Enemella evansiae]OYN93378.1 molecular chaperone DnaK [Enemella evansiae]